MSVGHTLLACVLSVTVSFSGCTSIDCFAKSVTLERRLLKKLLLLLLLSSLLLFDSTVTTEFEPSPLLLLFQLRRKRLNRSVPVLPDQVVVVVCDGTLPVLPDEVVVVVCDGTLTVLPDEVVVVVCDGTLTVFCVDDNVLGS